MALKKAKPDTLPKENTKYCEEVDKTSNLLNQGMIEDSPRDNSCIFFKNEQLGSIFTPIQGLEINLEPPVVIAEGEYKFLTQNVNIEKNVETRYGIKNKAIVEFNISQIKDGECVSHDLVQKYNISNHINSSFYYMYKGLTGEEPIGRINLKNLLGIKGDCEIKHIQMDDGNIFPKIVNINAEKFRNENS